MSKKASDRPIRTTAKLVTRQGEKVNTIAPVWKKASEQIIKKEDKRLRDNRGHYVK